MSPHLQNKVQVPLALPFSDALSFIALPISFPTAIVEGEGGGGEVVTVTLLEVQVAGPPGFALFGCIDIQSLAK